eukprot:650373-Prorocentrum_lima.AAC.1
MTSSLVGSEMCIRDRPLIVAHWRGDGDSSGKGEGEDGRQRRGLHVCEAVSYTHLTLPTICSV